MVSTLPRLVATIVIALFLCAQSGIVSTALAMYSAVDHCCASDAPGTAEEGDSRCAAPECQCLSCLSIAMQETPVALAGFTEPGLVHFETPPTLTGGVCRTIDYPPEIA
jgi:hypothetical protein